MNKKKIIMMGIRKITMIYDGIACDVAIFNRITNETVSYIIGNDGVVREKPNQNGKVDYKCFKKASKAWKEFVC